MRQLRCLGIAVVAFAFSLALVPNAAFASTESPALCASSALFYSAEADGNDEDATIATVKAAAYVEKEVIEDMTSDEDDADKANKIIEYDRSLIKKIGTQEGTGHTICCPSFSCAYADAVIDGTVNDHEYYTCSCCTWTDWGGGNSSFRSVGTDEELLREAYDQISNDKPTVIHVMGPSGEHWIALIGYENVKDPDHLKLSNFIALDPWDGKQINAAEKYSLYGDGCEHVSDRTAQSEIEEKMMLAKGLFYA